MIAKDDLLVVVAPSSDRLGEATVTPARVAVGCDGLSRRGGVIGGRLIGVEMGSEAEVEVVERLVERLTASNDGGWASTWGAKGLRCERDDDEGDSELDELSKDDSAERWPGNGGRLMMLR